MVAEKNHPLQAGKFQSELFQRLMRTCDSRKKRFKDEIKQINRLTLFHPDCIYKIHKAAKNVPDTKSQTNQYFSMDTEKIKDDKKPAQKICKEILAGILETSKEIKK